MQFKLVPFLKSPAVLWSVAFLTGLGVFEFIFFSQAQERFALATHYRYGVYSKVLAVLILSIISLSLTLIFFWASFVSPYRYRIIYFITFCLAIFIEYGYQNAFSRFTEFQDVENAFIAADLQIALNSISMYFDFLALVPCLIFGIFLFFVKPSHKKGLSILFANVILIAGFFSLTSFFTRNTFFTVSPTAFFRTALDFPLNWYVGSTFQAPRRIFYNEVRQQINFRSNQIPKNNVVFIVDESVRGDHLSLNGYPRSTSVFLDELDKHGFIKNWGVAVAGTTCSMTANNLLLTGVSELPDLEYKIYKLPTVFQYAKAMGYKTMYIDGQVSNTWKGKPSDLADIDEKLTIRDFISIDKTEIDAEIARQVKQLTDQSTGLFVWINKSGVHKPYFTAYPESALTFAPIARGDNSRGYYDFNVSAEEIVNDYDNAIRYNSQSFFENLVGEVPPKDTVYVYTSDHGQSLRENGATVSHCSVTKPEANVPLLIISDPQNLPMVDTGFKASHSNIFATLLDLMNFPASERKNDYSLSLFKANAADSRPRFYYSGDLHGTGSGGIYSFDE